MALFDYRARSARGDLMEGRLEAPSAEAVASQLLGGGVTPVHIVPAAASDDALALLRARLTRRRPGLTDLVLLSRQMYTLVRSGVPLVRAIRGLAGTSRNPEMADVLRDVAENLESGRDLSSSLGRHPRVFSTLVVSMVRVGEETGRLEEAFLRIGQYLEVEKDTRDRIKAALRYPAFVLAAIGIAIGVINVLVIPAFAKVFERNDVDLPWATLLLMDVSAFFVAHWGYLLGGAVLAALGLRAWRRTETGRYRFDKAVLRVPVIGGIIQRATLGRFARAFALASRSGVPLVQALTVVAHAMGNDYVADRVLQMRNGVERGDTLARTAATTGMFTPLVLQMLAVGEESGAVDEMMEEVAGFYEREVDYDLRTLSASIEPVLVIAVGIMVLILALGVFLPMWDLAAGVGLRTGG